MILILTHDVRSKVKYKNSSFSYLSVFVQTQLQDTHWPLAVSSLSLYGQSERGQRKHTSYNCKSLFSDRVNLTAVPAKEEKLCFSCNRYMFCIKYILECLIFFYWSESDFTYKKRKSYKDLTSYWAYVSMVTSAATVTQYLLIGVMVTYPIVLALTRDVTVPTMQTAWAVDLATKVDENRRHIYKTKYTPYYWVSSGHRVKVKRLTNHLNVLA